MWISRSRLFSRVVFIPLFAIEAQAFSSLAWGFADLKGVLHTGPVWIGPAVAYYTPTLNSYGYSIGGLYAMDPAQEVAPERNVPLPKKTSLCHNTHQGYLANGKALANSRTSTQWISLHNHCISSQGDK